MPVSAPEQVRNVVAVTVPSVRSVDLSKTWINAFVDEAE
jgi:hypothetical protein